MVKITRQSLPTSPVWEMGEKEESGVNPNLVHTLRMRVTKKKKDFGNRKS